MKYILSFLVALTTSAQAQLSRLEQQSLKTHPSIKAAEADARALTSRGQLAKAPFRPMLSFTGVGAMGDDAAIFSSQVEPRNFLFAPDDPVGIGSFMAMWPLYTGGRDRSAASYANALTSQGDARLAASRLDVVRNVRVAYAELESALGALAAETAGVQAAQELLNVTEANLEAGSAPEAFVLKAKANVARSLRMRAIAEAKATASAALLREAIGLGPSDTLSPGEWDIPLTAPATIEEALAMAESRPELAAAHARAKAAGAMARSARQSAYPELNLVGMGTGMTTDDESDVFYKLGLVLSIPIVDGGMRRAEASENSAMAASAEQEAKLIRLRVNREVAAAWAEWQAAPSALSASESEVAAAQEAFRIAKLRYREGKAPQVEVEQATADLVQALAGRAESIAFQRIAWANLMRAVGINLVTGVSK